MDVKFTTLQLSVVSTRLCHVMAQDDYVEEVLFAVEKLPPDTKSE